MSIPNYSQAFKKRRRANWIVLGTTYATMYMARYNFPMANKSLSNTYGFDTKQVGTIITAASLLYGISALFNGPIGDKIGGRKAMLIGSIGAIFFNLAFGLGAYIHMFDSKAVLLIYFATIWSCNSYFQSFSALALIKVNAGWFHVNERGRFSAIFGAMLQSGRLGILALGGWLVVHRPWQWVFFVPAILLSVMSLLTFLIVQDTPAKVGLIDLDTEDATSQFKGKVNLAYVLKMVFTNPITITIAAAEFCTGVVRKGFEEWFPRYMQEHLHMSLDSSIFQKGAWTIVAAGVAGAFAAGYLSDMLFNHRRPPVALIGYGLQVLALVVISLGPSMNWIIPAFVVNSFAVSMVHSMLSGTASMDFGGQKAAATAAGFFDGMQYVGGALAGFPLGWIIQTYGWRGWGPSLAIFSIIGFVFMATLWNAKPNPKAGGH